MARSTRIAVEPEWIRDWLVPAVEAGGGLITPTSDAEVLVWGAPDDRDGLAEALNEHGDHLRWVQLPWAGIEPYVDLLDDRRTWTCGKGVYAEPVAEMALTLALACMRGIDHYARSTRWLEHGQRGVNLRGANVCVLGGGGITEALLRLLGPFACDITVVRNRPSPLSGASRVVGPAELDGALEGADLVVLALALTPDTEGIIDAGRLALLHERSVLVNVARGGHVVTEDLVHALCDGTIGAAGLDVVDPEPLPEDHPLWTALNCIITPHVGNTPEMAHPLLAERITSNVTTRISGGTPIGTVNPRLGY